MTGRRLNLFSLLSIKFKSGDIAWYESQMSIDYTDLINYPIIGNISGQVQGASPDAGEKLTPREAKE